MVCASRTSSLPVLNARFTSHEGDHDVDEVLSGPRQLYAIEQEENRSGRRRRAFVAIGKAVVHCQAFRKDRSQRDDIVGSSIVTMVGWPLLCGLQLVRFEDAYRLVRSLGQDEQLIEANEICNGEIAYPLLVLRHA